MLCDGVLEPEGAGLSKLGRRWVSEMNRLGMVIDLTHISETSMHGSMDLTLRPPVFTHANPRKLVDSRRDITDARMKRVAALGGCVGVTNWAPPNFRPETGRRPKLCEHLDAIPHVADLIGVEHVSMGTDMSHGTCPDGDLTRNTLKGLTGDLHTQLVDSRPCSRLRYVEGFDDFGQLPDVAEAMMGRGFSTSEVEGILGGNLLRVFRQVWGG
jgi:membrane dipeptidase